MLKMEMEGGTPRKTALQRLIVPTSGRRQYVQYRRDSLSQASSN
jgi:hypothetical protein